MRQVGEPSVEEILESIKKVIARDNRSDAAAERRVRESRGIVTPAADDEDEVLDLAETGEFIDELELDDPLDDSAAPPEAPLVTEDARSSMRDSLAALAMLAEPGAQPQIVRSGETSLEGLTRELLRPALAEWLDKNLPPLVERLVAAEIARIVGKKV
jgi:cell pole-organizing protein PopZ